MTRISDIICHWLLLLLLLLGGSAQAVIETDIDIVVTHEDYNQTERRSSFNSRNYEHILLFDVEAAFAPNGGMQVNENIVVQAMGRQIQRGIFRTLPLSWHRQDGKFFSVDYNIIQIWRNGKPEPYSLSKSGNSLTLRIGNSDQLLPPGTHHYVIQYQVSNHFSRFPDWDELYWNVTGNGWTYDIDKVRFRLQLPDTVSFLDESGKDTRLRSIDVYTGKLGEKGHNADILSDGSIETLRPLKKGEGLTVVYTWPRSVLASAPTPEAASPLVYMLFPTLKTYLLWVPVLLLALYYFSWWRKHVSGVRLKIPAVIPLYAVPEDITPGYLRYICQRKYDSLGFASDILDLVAKRYVEITQKKSRSKEKKARGEEDQWLSRLPENTKYPLNKEDRRLLSTLFTDDSKSVNLSKSHHKPMQNANKVLKKRYETRKDELFLSMPSLGYIIPIILLIPLLCGILYNPVAALVTVFALIMFLPGCAFLSLPIKFILSPKEFLDTWGWGALIFSLIFGSFTLFCSGFLIFNVLPNTQLPAGYAGAMLTSLLLYFGFKFFMPRYTQQGLDDLALAKGLKMYLGTAERYRYQTLYPPEQWISHFERMLPYALALGVGKTWANTFAQYLIDSGATSEAFTHADWQHVRHFSDSCKSSSRATPSSTSSSGSSSGSSYSGSGSSGRGSSGGGSGGGGGGGW